MPVEAFDVLLPNAQEALRLAGRSDGDVEAAARELAARGPTVVVKLGADGALAVRGDEIVRRRRRRRSVDAPAPATRSTPVSWPPG